MKSLGLEEILAKCIGAEWWWQDTDEQDPPKVCAGRCWWWSISWMVRVGEKQLWRRRGSWNDVDMSHVQIGLHVLEVV